MKIRFRTPEAADPQRDGGMRLPAQQSKRAAPRGRWILITLLALSPAIWIGATLLWNSLWVDAGAYIVFEESAINAPASGSVKKVNVANGQTVPAGASLLELDDATLRAELDALRESVALSHRGATVSEEAPPQRVFNERRKLAASRLETLRSLRAEGAATQGEVIAAQAQLAAVEDEIATLARNARDAERSERERMAISTDTLTRIAVLNERIRALTITAPIAGVVDNLSVTSGQNIARDDPILVIRQGKAAVIAFMEGRALELAPGTTVSIRLPNKQSVAGTVLGLAPSTRRLPAELAGSFDPRSARLQVMIEPTQLPPEARVHRLPVRVRFFRFGI
jgi:multidrug resistance efflux pump